MDRSLIREAGQVGHQLVIGTFPNIETRHVRVQLALRTFRNLATRRGSDRRGRSTRTPRALGMRSGIRRSGRSRGTRHASRAFRLRVILVLSSLGCNLADERRIRQTRAVASSA